MKLRLAYVSLAIVMSHGILLPSCYAAFEDLLFGARPTALAGACVGLNLGPEAVFYNPSGLRLPVNHALFVFFTRPYGLKELEIWALSYYRDIAFNSFAIAASSFGYTYYKERIIYVSFSKAVLPSLQLGITTKINSLFIKNYGSYFNMGVDLGLQIHVSPQVTLGICAKNVNRPRLKLNREPLPQQLTFGACYQPLKQINLVADLVKDVRFPLEFRFGVECLFMSNFNLLFGIRNNPSRFSCGISLHLKYFNFVYAVSTHCDLGLTHAVTLNLKTLDTKK